MKLKIKQVFTSLLFVGLICSFNMSVNAKPEIKPLAPNIAELGSKYYQFKIKNFVSKDQLRTYKVWLAVPNADQLKIKAENPEKRSIFMLDGNAVMLHFNETILQNLVEHDAPVLVAIGYETNLPFETASRSVDYTPADLQTGLKAPDPRAPERMSGGSVEFKQLVETEIAPWVESQTKLDPDRRALWGHSYGGLFVLDNVLCSEYFSHYFAASPSLSWADQRMMHKIENQKVELPARKYVLLMEGDVMITEGQPQSRNFDAEGVYNLRKVLANLDSKGVDAKFLIYPNLKHGEVFKASLLDALKHTLY